MKTRIKIILGAVIFFLFCGVSTFFGSPADAQVQTFPVVQVVDGQTIVTDIRGKKETVKLLGIQTPKTTQCFGKAAEDKLKSYINDKSVILINDNTKGNRDSSGELIRYVYLPNSKRTFVNGELVKQGYAYSDTQDKTTLLNKFNSFEAYAKLHSLGIWEACPANTIAPTIYVAPVVQYVAPTTYIAPTTPPAAQSSSGLSNNNYYQNVDGNEVHSPADSTNGSVPAGATAQCSDGTYSFSQHHSGTCSGHGGVSQWL